MPNNLDQDTELLAAIAKELQGTYVDSVDKQWHDSPFTWILTRRSSRQRGKIGEQLVAEWLKKKGLKIESSPDSDADRLIEGHRVEIKFSTMWEDGKYVFQQIRDQNYEYLLCLGISPLESHAWVMKKSEIPFDKLKHQHGGDERGRDTWWFSVNPADIPDWLKQFGGSLTSVLNRFKS